MNYFEHNARANPPRTTTVYRNCIYIEARDPGAFYRALASLVPVPATFMPRLTQQTRLSQAKLLNELVVFWGHERPEDTLARTDAAVLAKITAPDEERYVRFDPRTGEKVVYQDAADASEHRLRLMEDGYGS